MAESYPHSPTETSTEYYNDITLCLAFSLTALIAFRRMHWSYSQGGVETTVVTAFYSLILLTSTARAVWFGIPSGWLEPDYVPGPIMAFSGHWIGTFVSELLLAFGSLTLFSIFILILVYWADILKKYFFPGVKRNKPISTFLTLVGFLFLMSGVNCGLFLLKFYSSEGMILVDSIILGAVSLICVFEISIFSHRFRTVLRTLGAINQVSTESQVKRIVWITVTGNVFFLVRATLEISLTVTLMLRYNNKKTFMDAFTDKEWDTYILAKHWSEVAIVALMLYILQSRFTSSNKRGSYTKVPDAAVASDGVGAQV
ncbi:hypothetical protein TrLO_g10507 [Triparma laevis f. longispina]|uniref:Uncharacterized protein n=1 Tax=Triparma laevis f. longispina TaxID=1714387 RepID=A0A9W7FNC3_9STRA|nr:hypothetical protein TrLO_g10507 [Triparma laevis f. longispina]